MMSFGLKNIGVTYQRMITKVFDGVIGKAIEVYVDDIIVKTPKDEDHVVDLKEVFNRLRRHIMRLNPL